MAPKTTSSRSASSLAWTIPIRASTRSTFCSSSRTSLHCQAAGRRQDGALRREIAALRRLVVHSSGGGRRLADIRRFGRLLNSQRLKGIHLAIKSGMLAAETAFDAMVARRFFASACSETFQDRVEKSWIKTELWPVRNFHQGFEKGFLSGMFHAGIQQFTGGRGLQERYTNRTPGTSV